MTDEQLRRGSTQLVPYIVFSEDPGPQDSVAGFCFDRDPQRMEFTAEIYNADDPDLDAFRERGGTLLM